MVLAIDDGRFDKTLECMKLSRTDFRILNNLFISDFNIYYNKSLLVEKVKKICEEKSDDNDWTILLGYMMLKLHEENKN